jgi:hypothetical protein
MKTFDYYSDTTYVTISGIISETRQAIEELQERINICEGDDYDSLVQAQDNLQTALMYLQRGERHLEEALDTSETAYKS